LYFLSLGSEEVFTANHLPSSLQRLGSACREDWCRCRWQWLGCVFANRSIPNLQQNHPPVQWTPVPKLWIYAATSSYLHLMILLISCPGKAMTEVTGKEQSCNCVVVKWRRCSFVVMTFSFCDIIKLAVTGRPCTSE